MKIKTSELSGAALDWAVATADGRTITYDGIAYWVSDAQGTAPIGPQWQSTGKPCGYSPSTNWAHGGPIIERMCIQLERRAPCFDGEQWGAWGSQLAVSANLRYAVGPTPLVAAMRCYVAGELGDEVDIPEELLK